MSAPILVIGVGNPTRGDDGAGRAVARRISQRNLSNVRVVETEGEATALLSLIESEQAVYLIDACVSGAAAGSVRRIDVTQTDLPEAAYGLSSHGFGLAEALALAKTLRRLPRHCIVYAIEAARFDMGAPLSEPVGRSVDAVASMLIKEIARLA
ncbi:MAG: hydrogenase maturation protease [Methylocystis sp.]|uniref:hydrogenase maturation protease n=1 Tax=Methylocystis sp. TaxID=1911079 RepID=UPI003DA642CF